MRKTRGREPSPAENTHWFQDATHEEGKVGFWGERQVEYGYVLNPLRFYVSRPRTVAFCVCHTRQQLRFCVSYPLPMPSAGRVREAEDARKRRERYASGGSATILTTTDPA